MNSLSGSQTWSNNSTAGTLVVNSGVTSSASGTQTLTIGGAGNTTIGGLIGNGSGTVALTMNGTGTLTLSASNTFSGPLTINAGIVATNNVNSAGSAQGMGEGSLVLNGGTFESTETGGTLGAAIFVGANGGTLFNNANNSFQQYTDTFTGSGTLTLKSAASSFNNGQLAIEGNSPNFSGNIIIGGSTALQRPGAVSAQQQRPLINSLHQPLRHRHDHD